MTKVLIVATSRKTRGGITSVIKAHETGIQWQKFHCKWIETHRDGNNIRKIIYFIKALFLFILLIPYYDIVHIHMAIVERKIPFIFIAKLLRKKIIIHLHVPDPQTTILSKKKKLYGWCFKKANIVLVLSSQWKNLLSSTYNIHNIKILYNPCPKVKRKELSIKKRILYAGTITERKGYKDLLYAFSLIAQQHKDWFIDFIGNGDIKAAEKISKELKISNQVHFKGWVQGEKKEKAFQEAAIYCLPSYAEGFPMGVLDAWAYGLPVICTPVGGLPDIIKDQENCLTFTPGNVTQLAQQLTLLIENEKLRYKLHTASCKLADGPFSITTINNQLDKIYSSLT